MYKINIQITDDDIITAVMNGLYVSAFISYMIMMTIVRLRLDTPEKVEEYLGSRE